MIQLGRFFARIIPRLVRYFGYQFQAWHLAIFAGAVALVVVFLDNIVEMLVTFGGRVMYIVVWLITTVLGLLLDALPGIPDNWPEVSWTVVYNVLGPVNRYMPLEEILTYLGLLVGVYGAVLIYKLARFLRGGG